MLKRLKRQDCLDMYKVLPQFTYDRKTDEETFFYPETFKTYTLTLPSVTFRGNAGLLARELTRMAKVSGVDQLIFLGDHTMPWLRQDNDYPPAKKAQQYLSENKVGKRFNGGLAVDIKELTKFVTHLCWLVRCNASMSHVYFTDPGLGVIGDICKYGNLHLGTINAQTDIIVADFLNNTKFRQISYKDCYNKFGRSSTISGRRIIV